MSQSAAEREARGRAGEFRVASELCRRNMFAALTMGRIRTRCLMDDVAMAQLNHFRCACA